MRVTTREAIQTLLLNNTLDDIVEMPGDEYNPETDSGYNLVFSVPSGIPHTNDFELCLNKKLGYYFFSVETLLGFNSDADCKRYMEDILREFTKWAKTIGVDTDQELDMYDVFTSGMNINTDFDSVQSAYTTFKFLVRGFSGKQTIYNC